MFTTSSILILLFNATFARSAAIEPPKEFENAMSSFMNNPTMSSLSVALQSYVDPKAVSSVSQEINEMIQSFVANFPMTPPPPMAGSVLQAASTTAMSTQETGTSPQPMALQPSQVSLPTGLNQPQSTPATSSQKPSMWVTVKTIITTITEPIEEATANTGVASIATPASASSSLLYNLFSFSAQGTTTVQPLLPTYTYSPAAPDDEAVVTTTITKHLHSNQASETSAAQPNAESPKVVQVSVVKTGIAPAVSIAAAVTAMNPAPTPVQSTDGQLVTITNSKKFIDYLWGWPQYRNNQASTSVSTTSSTDSTAAGNNYLFSWTATVEATGLPPIAQATQSSEAGVSASASSTVVNQPYTVHYY